LTEDEPDEKEAAAKVSQAAATQKRKSTTSRRTKGRQSTRGGGTTKHGGAWAHTLTSLEKCTIGTKELEQVQSKHAASLGGWDKIVMKMSAEIEERTIALEELVSAEADAMHELTKLDMQRHNLSSKPQTKLTEARIVRTHEESLKLMDGQVGKLALKSSSIRFQIKTVGLTLKAKEEDNEDLRRVDFDILKIANEEVVDALAHRNSELNKLKIMTSRLAHQSDALQSKIQESCAVNDKIQHTIHHLHLHDKRSDADGVIVAGERHRLRSTSAKYTKTLAETKVPPVLSYVAQKAELQEVARQIAMWTNHTKTAKSQATIAKKAWRLARETNGAYSAPVERRARQPMDEGAGHKRRQINLVGTIDASDVRGPQGFAITESPALRHAQRSHSARSSLDRRGGGGVALPAIF
jgi:hypothetical protein